MSPILECLFIGGTADGKRLPVDATQEEQEVPSLTEVPLAEDEPLVADDAPVLDVSTVIEIYRRLEVDHEGRAVILYVLNGLSEEAIQAQMVKHFGEEKAIPMV